MTKTKVFGLAAAVVLGGAVIGVYAFAHADSGALAVTCSGTASGTNEIVWSAVATGGNAPYSFAWSGDSTIANATSSSVTGTYTTNATYTAHIMVTDASSTVATSSCSQAVTGIVMPTTTSTLNVAVAVNNAAGGSATSSNFTVSVVGAGATPSSFTGSASGTNVVVLASTTYSVGASTLANYSASESGSCTGPLAASTTASCTVTETYVPPTTPTSTPPLPRVNPPTLSIGANGGFLARGMTVTSVGTNSFTATVWGITYTVNWSGNLYQPFQFYFRYGNLATSTPTTQLKVGDEVGVAGTVVSSTPTTVTASAVRDYSITAPRPIFHPEGNGNGKGNEGNGLGNGGPSVSASGSVDWSARLGQLMQQFQSLQNLFKGHGNGK